LGAAPAVLYGDKEYEEDEDGDDDDEERVTFDDSNILGKSSTVIQ
jgi:hypothetical protein